MRYVYLLKEFARQARRSKIGSDALVEAIERAEEGKIDADLGGGLIKQRVARPGRGRSGGFRTIIAYRKGERAVFLYLFAKSQRPNIGTAELEVYQELAKTYDSLNDSELDELVASRGWRRIAKN